MMARSEAIRSAIVAAGLDPDRMPGHVAIIMDGNGRWARSRGWLRPRGHRQGAETVRMVIEESARLGISHLTLYAFSSENWRRPTSEIDQLMAMLAEFLRRELAHLRKHRIRLLAIGQLDRLPDEPLRALADAMAATADHDGPTVTLALSYGGRDEIVDACRALAGLVARGELEPTAIDRQLFADHLYAPELPDVDLVIRSAGEWRLSNFLPWQTAYAEFVALDAYWPAVDQQTYHAALRAYQGRVRRFGALLTRPDACAPPG